MSRIYFHSPHGHREIYGTERAWMGGLTLNVATGILATSFCTDLACVLPPGAYPLSSLEPQFGSGPRFQSSLALWMGGYGNHWLVDGKPYDCFEMNLNTCLAVGSDPLKLCARLHGQCEIHAYVEGCDRSWLAAIIRRGVTSGVLRDGIGKHDRGQWTNLAEWLESDGDVPVVTSYSVCAQFPNQGVARDGGWEPKDEADDGESEWYALSSEERWDICMTALRASGPRLRPEGWEAYRFGHNKDAFWLWEQVRAATAKKQTV